MLYNSINFSLPIEFEENWTVRTSSPSTFICPSDAPFRSPFPVVAASAPGAAEGEVICDLPSSSYVGCFGQGDPSSLYPYNPTDAPPGRDAGEGLFSRNRGISIPEITDGTSQTFAVGERSQGISRATWAGVITDAVVPMTHPQGEAAPPPAAADALVVSTAGGRDGPNAVPPSPDQFGSGHPGGAFFLYADGSARFMKDRRPSEIFRALATRAGSEMISDEPF